MKQYDSALASVQKALEFQPQYAEAHLNKGNLYSLRRRYDEAIASFDRALLVKPNLADAWLGRGNVLRELARYDEAFASYDRALALKPALAGAWIGRGNVFSELKRYEEAFAAYDKALTLKPDLAGAWLGRGNVFTELKRYEEAFAAYDKALTLKPDLAGAWLGRGNVFTELKRYDEAFAAFDKALALEFDLGAAWLGRGNVFTELKRYEEAFAAYDKALTLKPDLAGAWLGRGNIFAELKRYDEALAAYDKALALKPDWAGAWLGRGGVFTELRRYDDAFAAYDQALALKPDLAEAWLGRGNVFTELKRYDEALAAYDKALALEFDLGGAWLGRGGVFTLLGRYDEAFAAYDKALALEPDLTFVEGARLHSKMHLCDWSNFDTESRHLISSVKEGTVTSPANLLAVSTSPEEQLQCAKLFSKKRYPASDKPIWQGGRYNHSRIRVAYLSADFRDHAASYLLVGIFEQHDRKRFETFGISFEPGNPSELLTRLKGSFDQFIDVKNQSDADVAKLLQTHEVDIAVDLMGYTAYSRTAIMAHRPSAIQVNFLGYPGTMGADYIDYLIADRTVIPKSYHPNYREKIVYLPTCYYPTSYQINDLKRSMPDKIFTREEAGLPQKNFVFCCFNNSYKITPGIFECWMRILKLVEGSVLWLLEANASVASNLRKEAGASGVNPERLVFAKRMSLPEHLARHRLADLFLDTFPCNAHTTASDALWAGLPVLTQIGETFAGRVAASLLNGIRLPELITSTQQEYAAVAIELATNPEKLAAIKRKLANNRLTTPLFDTQRFTKHIEAAYCAMHDRHQANLPPDNINVPE